MSDNHKKWDCFEKTERSVIKYIFRDYFILVIHSKNTCTYGVPKNYMLYKIFLCKLRKAGENINKETTLHILY